MRGRLMSKFRQQRNGDRLQPGTICVLAWTALLACAGCWQEVRHEAPQDLVTPPADSSPQDDEAAAEPPVLPPPQARATPQPTADDLFGDDPNDQPVVIVLRPPPAADPTTTDLPRVGVVTPQDRLDAWTAASDWSLAAAAAAKGLAPDRYANYLAAAEQAAAALGLELPPLPAADDGPSLEAEAVAALRSGAGAELVAQIADRTDDATSAAARLALDAHLMLLVYSPRTDDGPAAAAAIRAAAQEAALPADLWQPLANLLDRRAEFTSVRSAVFALREDVARHLAEQAPAAAILGDRE